MKAFFFTSILIVMCFFTSAQKVVYNPDGKAKDYQAEDLEINFHAGSGIQFPPKTGPELAPALLALLPTVVNVGMKLTTSALENRAKKFSCEYTKQKSNLDLGSGEVPHFDLIRTISFGGKPDAALLIKFKAQSLPNFKGGFVYYIESIDLNYAAAKVTSKHKTLDYTFEIKVGYFIDKEKKIQELAPITVTSVRFGKNDYTATHLKYRSDIIPLPEGTVLADVAIKVIESNPAKVKAEKILALWNNQKEEVKTIINNFLPKEEKSEEGESGNEDESTGNEKKNGVVKPKN